jgi:hypothetical protein
MVAATETANHAALVEIDAGLTSTYRRAALVQTETAGGALHQLAALNEQVFALGRLAAKEKVDEADEIERACGRLLYSVAKFIEGATGANMESAGADYQFGDASPFEEIQKAHRNIGFVTVR